jgi:hypothetical protein
LRSFFASRHKSSVLVTLK